jgi:hypothetical protein
MERGYGIVIATGRDEFVVAGSGMQVTFAPSGGGNRIAGLATVDEGTYNDGKWAGGRRLNGDEIMVAYDMAKATAERQTGTGLRFENEPSIQRVSLYQYE